MSTGRLPVRKPRLLVLASTYPRWQEDPEPGFVHELSRRLVDRFEVTVLCPHAPRAAAQEELDGVRVIRYRYAPERFETLVNGGGIVSNLRRSKWKMLLAPTFVLAQLMVAWRLVRGGGVDAIHAHWILPQGLVAVIASCARRGARVPVVVTSHGADLFALRGRVARALKRFVVTRTQTLTVVSGGMCTASLSLGVDPAKLHVASMGVDLTHRFTPDCSLERSRDEVLFVGRLVEKKGLRHLIDAMPRVIAMRPGAFLTVVGFGPELGERRAQVRRLGLEGRVHFVGALAQHELPALYRRAAVFVAPFVEAPHGDQEGLGLVVVEAAGCGCPVVVSDLPATRSFGTKSAGILRIPKADPNLIAEGILAVALPSPADLHDLRSRFDWSSRARRYAGLIQRLIEERSSGPGHVGSDA